MTDRTKIEERQKKWLDDFSHHSGDGYPPDSPADDTGIVHPYYTAERAIALLKRLDHMRTCRSMKHEDVWQSLFEDNRRFLADEEGT